MNLNKQQGSQETRKSFLGFLNEQGPEIVVAFSGQYVYGMCEGANNRLYAEPITGQVLELDISSTKFTKIRTIKVGNLQSMCYVPLLQGIICATSRGQVLAVSCTDGTTKWVVKDTIQFKQINPGALLYLTKSKLLLVSDGTNNRILVLDSSTGAHQGTIDLGDMGTIVDMCFQNDQIVIMHGSAAIFNLSYCSFK